MFGLGTVINGAGIIFGGLLGLVIGKGLKQRFQDILLMALGLSVIFLSIGDTLEEMLYVDGSDVKTQGIYMMIIALVLGALAGEALNIEGWFERFGQWLKIKTGNTKDPQFVNGFVTSSLIVCIGAMAIIGAIKDGIYGDISILVTKTILDAVIIMVMTASDGKGCIFSFIPVVIWQGSVTALAVLIEPVLTEAALSNLSLVGSILICCIGINMSFRTKIKVANFLPAIIVAVICAYIPGL